MEKFKAEIEEEQQSQKGSILFGLYKKEWKPFLFRGGPKDDEADGNATSIEFNAKIAAEKDQNGEPAIYDLAQAESFDNAEKVDKDVEKVVQ